MTRRFIVVSGLAVLSGCGGKDTSPATPLRSRSEEVGIVPVGATIPLRTVSRIEPAPELQSFGAVVVGDVLDSSGRMLFGSGAPARLVIRNGELALSAVMIYGTWRAIAGDDGGPAPLGTLVRGTIEPPPPGAAVRESTAIRTSGRDLQVPAGSLLIFRLDAPARCGAGL